MSDMTAPIRAVLEALKATPKDQAPRLWLAARELARVAAAKSRRRGHAVWVEHMGPDGPRDGSVFLTFTDIERARDVCRRLNHELGLGPLVRFQVLPDVSILPPPHDADDAEIAAWLNHDRRP